MLSYKSRCHEHLSFSNSLMLLTRRLCILFFLQTRVTTTLLVRNSVWDRWHQSSIVLLVGLREATWHGVGENAWANLSDTGLTRRCPKSLRGCTEIDRMITSECEVTWNRWWWSGQGFDSSWRLRKWTRAIQGRVLNLFCQVWMAGNRRILDITDLGPGSRL